MQSFVDSTDLIPAGAALADSFNRGWIDAIPKPVAWLLLLVGCLIPALLPSDIITWGLIATSSLMLGCIAIAPIRHWLSGTS